MIPIQPIQRIQPNKRIVSKSRYVVTVGKKAVMSFSGLSLYLLGLLGLAACFVLLTILCTDRLLQHPVEIAIWGVMTALSTGTFLVGRRTLKKGVTLDTGIPLTRANTADLPAPDSLVRASTEPMQAHEAVLLRAATEGQEQHEEQLLRAVGR